MLSPERRSRTDLVVAAAIVVVVVLAASIAWLRSDARGTTSIVANTPLEQANTGVSPPATLTERWRADSAATPSPVVTGSSVVTADGGLVTGRDPRDGTVAWSYDRDMPVCDVVAAWNTAVAVYRDERGCSQVTELDGSTGIRKAQRTSDADQQIDLAADGTYVSSRGDTRMELWRSDMVRTLEYGRVDAPVNPTGQPRSSCTLLSSASSTSRLAVLERCPGESADRLTVLNPAPKDAQEPEEYGSSVVAQLETDGESDGAPSILATSGDRIAMAIPATDTGEARIGLYDGNGNETAVSPVPDAVRPSTHTFSDSDVSKAGPVYTWWTGTGTLALDLTTLQPAWSLPNTLGPGAVMGGKLLVPVPGGLAVVEPATGTVERVIDVDRSDPGEVGLAVIGGVVVEQRADRIVALS